MPSILSSVLLVVQIVAAAGSTADDTLLLQVEGHQSPVAAALTEKRVTVNDASNDVAGSFEVDKLLARPEAVFDDISSKVNALEKDLAEMRQRNELSLASHVKMFKTVLEQQAANNTALTKVNDDIRSEIKSLTASNADKRQAAKDLTAGNQDLTDGLKRARKLIETTQEFVGRSLEQAADGDAPDLKVLAELDEQDAAKQAVADHSNRLKEIQFAEVADEMLHRSMLQVGSPSQKAKGVDNGVPAVEGLVKGLGSGLSEFALRAQEGESELKARFAASYKVGADKHAALLEEQTELIASRSRLLGLERRLAAALEHLQSKRTALQESMRSLQGFAVQKLGKLDVAQ